MRSRHWDTLDLANWGGNGGNGDPVLAVHLHMVAQPAERLGVRPQGKRMAVGWKLGSNYLINQCLLPSSVPSHGKPDHSGRQISWATGEGTVSIK